MRPEQRAHHERDEATRRRRLVEAQERAIALFEAVEETGVVQPGLTESAASDAIRDLAAERFGVRKHWHKRIIRSGPNTLHPYWENPPDRVIDDDDVVFADFGPIFEGWEADLGRTWALGDDPVKHRLCRDVVEIWDAGRAHFDANPDSTGEDLYREVVRLAEERGWTFGNRHCGHLIGQFPHENPEVRAEQDIMIGNALPLRRLDASGRECHWILEIHLTDPERRIGAFHEQLLTLA